MFNKTLKNLIENQKLNNNGEHHIQQYKPTPITNEKLLNTEGNYKSCLGDRQA